MLIYYQSQTNMKTITQKGYEVNITDNPIMYAILQITEIACTNDPIERLHLAQEVVQDLSAIDAEIKVNAYIL